MIDTGRDKFIVCHQLLNNQSYPWLNRPSGRSACKGGIVLSFKARHDVLVALRSASQARLADFSTFGPETSDAC